MIARGRGVHGARAVAIEDQARAAPPGQVRPNPLQEDADAKIRCRQELEMNGGPRDEREKATQMESPGLENRVVLADDRHRTFVEIAKRTLRRSPGKTPADCSSDIPTELHRDLRVSGKRFPVSLERCRITDHEDVGMPRN